MNICLISDEPINASVMEEHLLSLGHNALSAIYTDDGSLQEHPADKPDLFLVGLPAPGAAAVRKLGCLHERYPQVPIVLITDRYCTLSASSARACGVYAYLHKPIHLEELELLLLRLEEQIAEAIARIQHPASINTNLSGDLT